MALKNPKSPFAKYFWLTMHKKTPEIVRTTYVKSLRLKLTEINANKK